MKLHVETKEPNTFRFPVESIEITQTEGEKGALKHSTNYTTNIHKGKTGKSKSKQYNT